MASRGCQVLTVIWHEASLPHLLRTMAHLQKSMPSLAESLQFSPSGVKRLKGKDSYSVEVRHRHSPPRADTLRHVAPGSTHWHHSIPQAGCLVPGVFSFSKSYLARGPCRMQINESDLTFLSTLGTGASSVVHKALLTRPGSADPPKYVAVKKISNLNEVRPAPCVRLLPPTCRQCVQAIAPSWQIPCSPLGSLG
jgi:hypothetical protein